MSKHRKTRIAKTTSKVVVAIIAVLIVLRMAAPTLIETVVNRSLEDAPGITGSIADVDLHLYRGAYEIEGIDISTVSGDVVTPLIKIDEVDLSVLWSALFKGKVVAEMIFESPRLSIVDKPGSDKEKYESATNEKTWFTIADTIAPIAIDRIQIKNGSVHFIGKSDEKEGVFYLDNIDGVVKDIALDKSLAKNDLSTVKMTADLYGVSKVVFNGSADLRSEKPTFDVDASAEKISVKHFDKLIQVYAPFDLEGGELDFAMEMKVEQGAVDGYLKAGAHKLDVFSWKQDLVKDGDNPFELFLDGIIGGISAILTNQKTDLVATRVPLDGRIDDLDRPIFPAILGFLKNAFVKAYKMKVDDIVSFQGSEKDKESESDS